MEEHYDEGVVDYEVSAKPGYHTVQLRLTSVNERTNVRPFRDPINDRSEIRGFLFGGFAKCVTDTCKFEVDTERVFAMILEQDSDVAKWFLLANRTFASGTRWAENRRSTSRTSSQKRATASGFARRSAPRT